MFDLAASIHAQRTRRHTMGMIKTWEDVARYEMLIRRIRPAVMIECGTDSGGSATWFGARIPLVVTVDVRPPEVALGDGVRQVCGSSVDPAVVARVVDLVGDRGPVMVSLDSDHSADHVYQEMLAYGPLVTAGSYLVVEDGILRWVPEQLVKWGSSPLDAIERYLAEHDDFVVDGDVEGAFPQTQFPRGWLRKAGRLS